jgi:glycine oxidase
MVRPTLAVVGGGTIGYACAWRLAQRVPDAQVLVLDPSPGGGASTVAAGLLAPVTEATAGRAQWREMALASAKLWPRFAAELSKAGGDPGYRTEGTLVVALDADGNRELDELATELAGGDLAVEPMSAERARQVVPGLSGQVRAALFVPDDHSVDTPLLHRAVRLAAERAGVETVLSKVERIVDDGSRVTGVELANEAGALPAEAVVVAAGSWSSSLHPALEGQVRPVMGEVLLLRQRPGAVAPPTLNLRAVVGGEHRYLVPRADGQIVVGATQVDAGFDATPSAAGALELLRDALRVMPGLVDYSFDGVRSGLRPAVDGEAPLIGPVGPGGLVAATGHFRNGILLTPVTAEQVAATVADFLSGRPGSELLDATGV